MKGRLDAHSYSVFVLRDMVFKPGRPRDTRDYQRFLFLDKKNKIRKARTDGGRSGVVCKLLQAGGRQGQKARILTSCMQRCTPPVSWYDSLIALSKSVFKNHLFSLC